MLQWFTDNWLAALGVLVGAIALFLNFTRFFHSRKRDTIQLEVSGEPHEHYKSQLQSLIESREKDPWECASLLEVYKVRITNKGSVPAQLEDAGVITKDGKSISVLTHNHKGNSPLHLGSLASSNAPPIDPKSSQTYWVYLKNDQEPFEVAKYFAIDKTGKKWSAKA